MGPERDLSQADRTRAVDVDPAWEIDTAAADGMTINRTLVTHTHQDHVGGGEQMVAEHFRRLIAEKTRDASATYERTGGGTLGSRPTATASWAGAA